LWFGPVPSNLHVHSDVTDQQFLPELGRLRSAPVHTLPTTFDLKPLRS
jgi:hypothetical protein